MKNRLTDLNNHLFSEMERLTDEALKGEALHEEIARAKAIANTASNIIANAALALKAEEFQAEWKPETMPVMLEQKKDG